MDCPPLRWFFVGWGSICPGISTAAKDPRSRPVSELRGLEEESGIKVSILLLAIVQVCVVVAQSCLTLCDPWTVAHQAPLSMGFFRQEYWSGLPFPSPGESSQPRDWTEVSYTAGKCFTIWATLEAQFKCHSREISVLSMNLSVNWACWGTSILTYKMIMLIMMLSPDRRISVILRNDGYGYNAKIIIMLNKISNTRLFAYWVYSFPKQYMRKVGKENNANFS